MAHLKNWCLSLEIVDVVPRRIRTKICSKEGTVLNVYFIIAVTESQSDQIGQFSKVLGSKFSY